MRTLAGDQPTVGTGAATVSFAGAESANRESRAVS